RGTKRTLLSRYLLAPDHPDFRSERTSVKAQTAVHHSKSVAPLQVHSHIVVSIASLHRERHERCWAAAAVIADCGGNQVVFRAAVQPNDEARSYRSGLSRFE